VVSVRVLPRLEVLSDHAPILISTSAHRPLSRRPFNFKLGWLQQDRFVDLVRTVWEKPVVG
jgi:hypothetical protein